MVEQLHLVHQLQSGFIIINNINDAPVVNPGITIDMSDINEDTPGNGERVSDLISIIGYTDIDQDITLNQDFGMPDDNVGIAITSANNSNGNWEFSTNGGSTWTSMIDVSLTDAQLLTPNSVIRFNPNSNYNGLDISFSFKAWDQSSNSTDASSGGGTSAFSINTVDVQIDVVNINDAPTISANPINLDSIIEDDFTSNGNYISDLLAELDTYEDLDQNIDLNQYAGVDNNIGMAITSIDSENGSWEYSLNNGGSWQSVGIISESSALLLLPTHKLRFVPIENFNGSAQFIFKAWDQSDNSNDISVDGGSTAFSEISSIGIVSINNINDAPTIESSQTISLNSISEDDFTNSGTSVIDLLVQANLSYGDVDQFVNLNQYQGIDENKGMAIISIEEENGNWEYSSDSGSSWQSIGIISEVSALLLSQTDLLRFIPNANYNGTASFEFRAWDQSDNSNDTSNNGGTTAFSTSIATGIIIINNINDAPVVNPGITIDMPDINEDTPDNGLSLAEIVSTIGYTDIDQDITLNQDIGMPDDNVGIAITSANNSNGNWEFSTNGGSSWTPMGDISLTNVMLLTPIYRIRFNPNENYNGQDISFSFKAWDRSSNSTDASSGGGTSAFSINTVDVQIDVININDAPTINTTSINLDSIDEDNFTSNGNFVSDILNQENLLYNDYDQDPALNEYIGPDENEGIAIVGITDSNGSWEYSNDNGESWILIESENITFQAPLLLIESNIIRFVPNADFNGSSNFYFRAWDQTSIENENAFSTAFSAVNITINPVNDIPTIDCNWDSNLLEQYSDLDAKALFDVNCSISDIEISNNLDELNLYAYNNSSSSFISFISNNQTTLPFNLITSNNSLNIEFSFELFSGTHNIEFYVVDKGDIPGNNPYSNPLESTRISNTFIVRQPLISIDSNQFILGEENEENTLIDINIDNGPVDFNINSQNNINGTEYDAYLLLNSQNIKWSENQNLNPITDPIFDNVQIDFNNPQILYLSFNNNGLASTSYLISGLKTEIVNTVTNNEVVNISLGLVDNLLSDQLLNNDNGIVNIINPEIEIVRSTNTDGFYLNTNSQTIIKNDIANVTSGSLKILGYL